MNIPSSLLFQNERIASMYNLSLQWFYIAFAVFLWVLSVSWVIFYFGKQKKVPWDNVIIPMIPWIQDVNFETKIAIYLRYLVYREAFPKHAYSHTSREIRSYMKESSLVNILSDIEKVEYNGETLPLEDRRKIINQLQNYSIKK